PDGKALAVGKSFGTIRVFAAADGQEICRCGLRKGSWVRALTFSPDGKTLAGGGTDERPVRFFDAVTGQELHRYPGHQNEVVGAAVRPDGKTLVSAGKDGPVCVWDLATGEETRRSEAHPEGVTALAGAPDGRALVTADGAR